MTIEAIHFAAPPYTSDLAVQKVIDLLETIIPYTEYQAINLHIIPFTEIQKLYMIIAVKTIALQLCVE